MGLRERLHGAVHRGHDNGFDRRASEGYARRADWTMSGLYRAIASDVEFLAGEGATVLDVGAGPAGCCACCPPPGPMWRCTGWTCRRT
ncbi:hypothetical protein [Actinokineospora iranica]|uniref:Uncharacterized protein n=1 Tax=Actinokineospora iranica TaxID=1271860 RepID=A0A1G6RXK5_9PSEU|nr:hypothetical protein [Actinokineospora iranica]SDD09308.1 hypothetical protein SAMN05216174_10786 [Actinokineospora iranica]